MDARDKSFTTCVELGKKLLQRKHQDSPEVRAAGAGGVTGTVPLRPPHDGVPSQIKVKLVELVEKKKAMMEMWEQRWDQLRLCECAGGAGEDRGSAGGWWQRGAEHCPSLPAVLEVCQFSRDASVAESWLMAQEPYLASSDYGQTVDAVEKLLKRHEAFEKSSATWEERIAALRKLTTVRKARDGARPNPARLCLPCLSFPTSRPHQTLTPLLPSPAAGAPGRADAA